MPTPLSGPQATQHLKLGMPGHVHCAQTPLHPGWLPPLTPICSLLPKTLPSDSKRFICLVLSLKIITNPKDIQGLLLDTPMEVDIHSQK